MLYFPSNERNDPVSLQKEIRSSLVLSMLQQMLAEDKADMVREAVVKSLGIIMAYIDDPDKYSQVCLEVNICQDVILFNATNNCCSSVHMCVFPCRALNSCCCL